MKQEPQKITTNGFKSLKSFKSFTSKQDWYNGLKLYPRLNINAIGLESVCGMNSIDKKIKLPGYMMKDTAAEASRVSVEITKLIPCKRMYMHMTTKYHPYQNKQMIYRSIEF